MKTEKPMWRIISNQVCIASTIIAIVIAVLLGSGINCTNGNGSPPEIRPAPIHEIKLNIAESYPPQVFVYVKGGLRDGCTTFHNHTTKRSGNTITISITTRRPQNAVCTQVYGYFEEYISLGSDFVTGETYTTIVNDQTTSFVMQ